MRLLAPATLEETLLAGDVENKIAHINITLDKVSPKSLHANMVSVSSAFSSSIFDGYFAVSLKYDEDFDQKLCCVGQGEFPSTGCASEVGCGFVVTATDC